MPEFVLPLDRTSLVIRAYERYVVKPPVDEGGERWIPLSVTSGDWNVTPGAGACVPPSFPVYGFLDGPGDSPDPPNVFARIVPNPTGSLADGRPTTGRPWDDFHFEFENVDEGEYLLEINGGTPGVSQPLTVSNSCP